MSQTPAYPTAWEADVVLRDGTTTHLRPIRPDDAAALQRFQERQSERSSYFRFFAPVRRLSAHELGRFTHVDHVTRTALVAVRPEAGTHAAAVPAGPGGDSRGERIVGVARFDVVEPGTAEVAFNVADSEHGRGLGSALLEHLASAARERGVTRFVAEVLPQNGSMLAVFREAGYNVSQRLEDGVVTVAVDLDPTERSRQVMADREHSAEARSMQALLTARRVLLVGPGPRPGGDAPPGYEPCALLTRSVLRAALADPGDTELFVVDPPGEGPGLGGTGEGVHLGDTDTGDTDTGDTDTGDTGTGDGGAVRPRLVTWSALPAVDLVLLVTPAERAVDAVRRLAGTGARGVVVLSAGFAETGPAGLERQRAVVRVAHGLGMRVVGPASYGIVTTTPGARLHASLAPHPPRPGTIGLFCQSSSAAVGLLRSLDRRHLGVSALVSAGHRADVSGNDLMQYWLTDPGTQLVVMYLESVGNPRKFTRIARRLAAEKPVVGVIAGRSGHVVPPGHAVRVSLAPRALLDELLRQSGVIRAENTHQLLDVAQVLAHQPLPRGRRVGVLASSATLTALVAEAVEAAGLEAVEASAFLPPMRSDADVERIVEAVYAEDACDAVVVADLPVLVPASDAVARAVARAAARTGRPTVVSMVGLQGVPEALAATAPDGTRVRVPAFPTPDDAVTALAKVMQYAAWRERDRGVPVRPAGVERARARRIVDRVLAAVPDPQAGVALDEATTTELLGCYGLEVWPVRRVRTADEAVAAADELGWPVALKSASPALRHRIDLGGVRLDLTDAEELRDAVERMRVLAASGGVEPAFEVQSMASTGVACVVRSAEDPLFGPVVSFALAGDAVELLDDVASAVAPLTDVDVHDLVRAVKASPRLFGYRGAPLADVTAVEDVVARVAVMADDLQELASLELYPVVASEQGVAVLHAAVRLRRTEERADPLRRALPTGR